MACNNKLLKARTVPPRCVGRSVATLAGTARTGTNPALASGPPGSISPMLQQLVNLPLGSVVALIAAWEVLRRRRRD